MSQIAAHLGHHAIVRVAVRQRVLSLPIPLRLLLAAQPEPVTTGPLAQRVVTRHPPDGAGLETDEAVVAPSS